MTKVFKKSQKKPILVPFWVLSCPNSPTKKGCQFLNIPIIYHHAQNQKKLKTHSWEKCRTDGRRDGQTDGRMDGRTDRQKTVIFLGPSVTGVQCVFPSGQFLINYEETIWHK